MWRILLATILLFSLTVSTQAQELRCNVAVNHNKIRSANTNTFKALQTALNEFVNNRKWTNDVFAQKERIECNIVIQLDEQISTDEFKGSINVQLRRPIYNSSLETTLLNIKDENFRIKYNESQQLIFNENSNSDNLTSIIAFYVYIILGMDYDSFSPNGGTEYFAKAMKIVDNAQSLPQAEGWRSYESNRNRYWLAENLTNRAYISFRQLTYSYHIKGLDKFEKDITDGRASIADALTQLRRLYRTRPNLYLFTIFFDAKTTELMNIFSGSQAEELNRVVEILNEIDPANSAKYNEMKDKFSF